VIQTRGANLMILATAISLPLCQLMFCIHAIAGPNTSKFLWTDAIALVIVLAGFMAYYSLSPEGHRQRYGAEPDGALRADKDGYTGGFHSGSRGKRGRGDGTRRPLLINNQEDGYDTDE
jgi:hypothetical protein